MRLVYIDENGVEHPVSGRPTSAENLPIAPGSPTMTKAAIDGKQKKIEYKNILDEAFNSATTYSYTGKSVTCPAGHTYIVRARISYSNSEPKEIGATNSTTMSDLYRTYARSDNSCEINFILGEGETAYIWARYNASASNMVRITAIDIVL